MTTTHGSVANKQLGLFCHLSRIVATLSVRIPWGKLDEQERQSARTALLELERALRHGESVRPDRAAILSNADHDS